MIFKLMQIIIPLKILMIKLKTNPGLRTFQKHNMTAGLHSKKSYPDHSNRLRNFQNTLFKTLLRSLGIQANG